MPMSERTMMIDGVRVPRFLYGTAWKEDQTQRLTELALRRGFRGIDTANQRRHYHEAAVGQAVAASVASGRVRRDDLFLQTKFTFQRGQDDRLPYDPAPPIARRWPVASWPGSPDATAGPSLRLFSGSPSTPAWCRLPVPRTPST